MSTSPGKKKTQAPSAKKNAAKAKTKLEEWASDICNRAHGRGTQAGFRLLGPVQTRQDLLLAMRSSSNPQATLAAEQVVHLVEAFRYVAASTSAYLSHANGASTHFSYYAELRAAMSLFAWSGMRLKWGKYYYLDQDGRKRANQNQNPGTHDAAWALWAEWVNRKDVHELLAKDIKIHPSVSLGHIIGAVNFTRPDQPLKKWGADLVRISKDHTARNKASYEASWLAVPLTQMQPTDVDLIRELWRLFLAEGSGLGFDGALCSQFVQAEVERNHGTAPAETRKRIAEHISANSGAPVQDILRRLDPALYSGRPFELAASADTDAANVLCRSFLLLRIALLALQSNLSASNTPNATRVWLKHWLEHAGIWSPHDEIEPDEIEVDYRDAVNDFSTATPLPSSLWAGNNTSRFPLLCRPDACIAWSLVA